MKKAVAASVLFVAAPVFGQDGFKGNPPGLYLSFSALAVFTEDSGLRDNTGGAIDAALAGIGLMTSDLTAELSTGIGLRAGVGYTFPAPESPVALTLELEYLFQSADFESISSPIGSLTADGNNYSNSIMGNLILDFDIVSGFGVYVGGGVGVTVVSADLSNIGGVVTFLGRDEDTKFAWQVLGGLKYAIDEHWVVFLGGRYFDAGDVNFATLGGEYKSLSIELGFRYYF